MSTPTDCEDPGEHLKEWAHIDTNPPLTPKEEEKIRESWERTRKQKEIISRYDSRQQGFTRRQVREIYLNPNSKEVMQQAGKALGYSNLRIKFSTWLNF
jgi:hypothetical protein